MRRKIVQDVVAPQRKKITRTEQPLFPKRDRVVAPMRAEREVFPYVPKMVKEHEPIKRRSYKGLVIWATTILSVVVLVFAFSLIYASATVKITPKIVTTDVDATFTAKKEASPAELQYELMTITKEGSDTVASVAGPKIETKAKGTVVFYNTTTGSQKLSVGASITSPKGLKYKTTATITIPAAKKVSGKTTPGSIATTVVAEKAGDSYNMKLEDLQGDFKIDLLKNTAKYTTMYARLKTNISGGASGVTQTVPTAVASTTRTQIQKNLQKEVLETAQLQIPEGYVMLDGAYVLTYESLPNTVPASGAPTPSVNINEKATFYGIIFNRDALVRAVAAKDLSKFNNGSINSDGLKDLDFDIVNKTTFKPQLGTSLVFSLKGLLKLEGMYPEKELKTALSGKHIKDISTVLSQYGTIATADVIIRPFWKQTFPNDPNKITIEAK